MVRDVVRAAFVVDPVIFVHDLVVRRGASRDAVVHPVIVVVSGTSPPLVITAHNGRSVVRLGGNWSYVDRAVTAPDRPVGTVHR